MIFIVTVAMQNVTMQFTLSIQAFYHIHEFWIVPVFLPIVIYLLWREVGPSSLIAMVLLLLQPLLQYALAQLYARWRCVCSSDVKLYHCKINLL